MRKLLGIFFVMFPMVLSAKTTVDLYGDEGEQAAQVLKKYTGPVLALEESLQQLLISQPLKNKPEKLQALMNQKIALLDKIKNDYGYAYVDLSTINYSRDSIYITIEVIRPQESHRLKLVDDHNIVNHSDKKDLIHEMEQYNQTGAQLFFNDQLKLDKMACPVFHCTWGFEHPQLKPFYSHIQRGVKNHKKMIIDTLHSDPSPERRAAAAFLVGHFDNPQEIIDLLTPPILDKDSGVRNNAMRVISATLMKYKAETLNIDPLLQLLQSPYDTDRNKSLLVLLQVTETNREKMIKEGKKSLLALLALKQPNNHALAYQLLKKLSGKNYPDTDLKSWKAWFDSV